MKPKAAAFPPGAWKRACDGWETAFQHVHGCKFRWNSRQAKGLSEILTAVGADLAAFERIAKAWLREPEAGLAKGHPLWQLAADLNYIESKIAKGTVGQNGTTHRNTAATQQRQGRINEGLTLD